jgi:hypothetical protein
MSATDDTQTIAREFMQLWATSTSNVMGQIVSGAFQIDVTEESTAGPLEPAGTDVYLTITVAGGARGEMSFRLPANVALEMARTFSGEGTSGNKELTADDRSALDELIQADRRACLHRGEGEMERGADHGCIRRGPHMVAGRQRMDLLCRWHTVSHRNRMAAQCGTHDFVAGCPASIFLGQRVSALVTGNQRKFRVQLRSAHECRP